MCNNLEFLGTVITLVVFFILLVLFIVTSNYWKSLTNEQHTDLYCDAFETFFITILLVLLYRYFLYCSNFYSKDGLILALFGGVMGIIFHLVSLITKDYYFESIFLLFQCVSIALFSSYWLFSKYIL